MMTAAGLATGESINQIFSPKNQGRITVGCRGAETLDCALVWVRQRTKEWFAVGGVKKL
jgi:hypothetical protein